MEVEISDDVASKKEYWDYYSTMETSFNKGKVEGHAEGLAEGMEKGKLEIARSMKTKGYAINDIADITGLSAKEIEAL